MEQVASGLRFKADLADAGLSGTDLKGANLRGANLKNANLSKANLNATVVYLRFNDQNLQDVYANVPF